MGPRTIAERLDCDLDACEMQLAAEREQREKAVAAVADVLEELQALKLVIQGRIDSIEEYLRESKR